MRRSILGMSLLLGLAAACSAGDAATIATAPSPPPTATTAAPTTTSSTSSTTTSTTTSTSSTTTTVVATTVTTSTTIVPTTLVVPATVAAPGASAPPAPAPGASRAVTEQDWIPFGVAGDVTLHYPSRRVERIGFHQSNDEGTRAIVPIPTGVPATTLESRGRLSDPNSAADIVVDPTSEIRSPVSGTVVSTGSYDLYCGLFDFYVNIAPDEHPGWTVRIIHLSGLEVGPNERVEAGVTTIAPSARQLPFASQVDDLRSAEPAWPHVHVEVSDPSIPNVDNPGSGYDNC